MGDSDLLRLPDGRAVQYWDGGGRGPAVLFFHGCPDTRHAAMTGATAAARAGVRLVALNRPGYGRSDPHDSTQSSVAADTVAAADRLGIGRFAALGMSVGGAYALVCAARHPDRVRTLGLVATPGDHRRERGSVPAALERARPGLERYAARVDPADPADDALAARWVADLPAADARLLTARRTAAEIAAAAREALVRHDGYLRDAALTARAWDAAPEDVERPTHLWYGLHDARNPPQVGKRLSARIPGARLVIRPTTHLATLILNWERILAALLD